MGVYTQGEHRDIVKEWFLMWWIYYFNGFNFIIENLMHGVL